MAQADIEAAIHAWIVADSALSADRVRWSGQGGTDPTSGAWISLSWLDETTVGQDWDDVTNTVDPDDGEEVTHTVRGSRSAMLSVQCFAGAARGNSSSLAILKGVVIAASGPTVRGALMAAEVGLGRFGPVRNVSLAIKTTYFEPRAVFEVAVLTAAASAGETGTNIEDVEITGTLA